MKTNIIILFSIMGLFSCTNRNITKDDIDYFISKYQNANFSNQKNIFVFQRSRGINEITYGVSKYEENKPLYFVDFNNTRKSITNINRSLLKKKSVGDYLTQSEINEAVNTINHFHFFLFGVDSSENVYINPFSPDEPPFFLRLKKTTGDSTIRRGYKYKLYKDNWYVKE